MASLMLLDLRESKIRAQKVGFASWLGLVLDTLILTSTLMSAFCLAATVPRYKFPSYYETNRPSNPLEPHELYIR